MGERWVTLEVDEDETLRCTSCSKYLHEQKVYLYLDVNNELGEIMCRYCWAQDQREGGKSKRKMKEDKIIAALIRIAEEVENDPEEAKKAEEFQRKYGTLTEEDLRITFTI